MTVKVSVLSEKSVATLLDEMYLVDNDAAPASKRLGLDRLLALLGVNPGGRLTLTSGTPVTTADVTGATNVYYAPYVHDYITLYDGTRWVLRQFTQLTLALGTLVADTNYDVFAYDNSGTVALELGPAWTNATTRSTDVTRLNGILIKSGTSTRRLLGTLRTTSTTATEDSFAKRFLSNLSNTEPRPMRNATETTDSWNYNTAAYRQANANTANQLDWVACVPERRMRAIAMSIGFTLSAIAVRVGIGIDSTTATSATIHSCSFASTHHGQIEAKYDGFPGVGRHFAPWLEYGGGSGTQTWCGDNGATLQAGIMGEIEG